MIGSKLGSYELEEEIGRGGMGIVYRASQPALGRRVAVKVLLPQLAQDAEFVERFLREARAAAKLEHPGVVTIYDVGEVEGTYYFSMQWLQGQTLEEILAAEGSLPVNTAISIAAQVAAALSYAHDAGIVHRDVKPGNVIMDHTGRAVLTDFGIARAASDTRLTRVGASVGSPDYMAPEQINGSEIDSRTDLYALGVLFYMMLTGDAPYTGDAPIAVAYQHLNAPVPSARERRPEVSPELDEVVRRLMAKAPGERFQSAGELLEVLAVWEPRTAELPLRPVTGPEAAVAAEPRPHAEPDRSSRRARWLALAVAVAVAVAAGAYWFAAREEEPAQQQSSGPPSPPTAPAQEPAPPLAVAAVAVEPDLADLEIWLAGEDTGLRTPAEVELEGEPGELLTLELRRNGEPVASRELTLGPGLEESWAPRLVQSLGVSSQPAGARVTLDGELLAEATPLSVELEPGRRYRLLLSLDGHESRSREFSLAELSAEQLDSGLSFRLPVSVPPGQLVVKAGYEVSVAAAGRRRSGSGEVRLELPPGEYDVELTAPSVHYSASERVVVESAQSLELPLPQAVTVNISANPSLCRVWIDGREVGYVPATESIAVGMHSFRFHWEGEGIEKTVEHRIGLATRSIFETP